MKREDYNRIAVTINKTWKRKYPGYTIPPTEAREFLNGIVYDLKVEFLKTDENFNGEKFQEDIWRCEG